MQPSTDLFVIILLVSILGAPAVAEDVPAADMEEATAALVPLAEAYQTARAMGFKAGEEMEALQERVDAYLGAWQDVAPAAAIATARTYGVRCLLSAGKTDEVFEQSGRILATEGISDDDAYKLLYYRGVTAVALDRRESAEECLERLEVLKPEIARALLSTIRKQWPLVEVGKLPPQWKLGSLSAELESGIDGELALEDLRGKYVLLDFWATWCGPCRSLMQKELAPLAGVYLEDDRFALVSVGTNWRGDTAAKQAEFASEKDYHWRKVFDATGQVTGDYGVQGIPTLTFIGPDGKVIAHGSGATVVAVVKETLAQLPASEGDGNKREGNEGGEAPPDE